MRQFENLLGRIRALEGQVLTIMAQHSLEEAVETPEQAARQSDRRREDALRISNIERDANRRVAAIRKKSQQG